MTDTNRRRLIAAIDASASAALLAEIDYQLDAYSGGEDETYDRADAFRDAWEQASGGLGRECLRLLAACGYLVARDPRAEVATTGRDRAPVIAGRRHDAVAAWSIWIEE